MVIFEIKEKILNFLINKLKSNIFKKSELLNFLTLQTSK